MNDLDFWNAEGYLVKERLISDDMIEAYSDLWLKTHTSIVNGETVVNSITGWQTYDIFRHHKELLEIFCGSAIPSIIESITGEPAGLHLNFTGWVSTQKTWHQDVTLDNKDYANHYIGVWVALDDIHPDSGPFQLIPKSHLWDVDFSALYPEFQRQNKREGDLNVSDIYGSDNVSDLPPEEDPGAAAYRYYTKRLEAERPEGISFEASKGDVIFWHGHTVHRGSEPIDKSLLRKAVIGHYAGVHTGLLSSQYAQKYKNGYYF